MCVDGDRGLVWDSEQRYAVVFNEDSLCMCVGHNTRKVRVRAMEMVNQREKNN